MAWARGLSYQGSSWSRAGWVLVASTSAVPLGPTWAGSAARRLVDAVALAAIQQLLGYAEEAGRWTRSPARTAPPIGLRRRWAPVEHGVIWLPADQLADRWDDATLVALTVDALDELPAGLPPSPGVYLCAAGGIDDDLWPAITQLQPDVVVHAPAGCSSSSPTRPLQCAAATPSWAWPPGARRDSAGAPRLDAHQRRLAYTLPLRVPRSPYDDEGQREPVPKALKAHR